MSNNSQKNQQFKTTDILTMFGLVGIIATLGGVVLARGFEDGRPNRALSSAEALAMQMSAHTEPKPSSLDVAEGRGPASIPDETLGPVEGEIGRDPWGQPFHYLVLSGAGHKRVVVWSDGANHRSESMESVRSNVQSLSVTELLGQKRAALFHGDDIGFVHEE